MSASCKRDSKREARAFTSDRCLQRGKRRSNNRGDHRRARRPNRRRRDADARRRRRANGRSGAEYSRRNADDNRRVFRAPNEHNGYFARSEMGGPRSCDALSVACDSARANKSTAFDALSFCSLASLAACCLSSLVCVVGASGRRDCKSLVDSSIARESQDSALLVSIAIICVKRPQSACVCVNARLRFSVD